MTFVDQALFGVMASVVVAYEPLAEVVEHVSQEQLPDGLDEYPMGQQIMVAFSKNLLEVIQAYKLPSQSRGVP